MRFKLGDRVVPQKTGIFVVSTVVGILTAENYHGMINEPNVCQYWLRYYPDYMEGNIIVTEFDEPIRGIPLDFFRERYDNLDTPYMNELRKNTGLYSMFIQDQYERVIPKTNTVGYPEDDLVLF